jgi:hypothetical protein
VVFPAYCRRTLKPPKDRLGRHRKVRKARQQTEDPEKARGKQGEGKDKTWFDRPTERPRVDRQSCGRDGGTGREGFLEEWESRGFATGVLSIPWVYVDRNV